MHQPVCMVSQCSLMPGCRAACGDQHWHTGISSALEALHDNALYKYTFTLLYFTGRMHKDLGLGTCSFAVEGPGLGHDLEG